MERRRAEIIPFRRPAGWRSAIGDLRFRRLLGEDAWAELPPAVRARFSKRLGGGRTIVYTGEIVECAISRAGFLLAQAARLIGGPLPLSRDCWVPAAVTVTEDAASGGQIWTRVYGRRRGFPQTIHSAKLFCGSTGLEEYLGCGFGIALVARVDAGGLHFLSDHYFLTAGPVRLRIPAWLSPGRMRVSHVECGGGRFAFLLELIHPLFGLLVRQTAMFDERPDPGEGARP